MPGLVHGELWPVIAIYQKDLVRKPGLFMILAVFMGDINHINPPVVPLFKGGQALGKSQMVPVRKVFSGKYFVSGTNARRPFFLSAVPLFLQKGDHRGIPYNRLFLSRIAGLQLSPGGKFVFHHLVVDWLYQGNRLSSALQHHAWYGNHQHGKSEIQDQ